MNKRERKRRESERALSSISAELPTNWDVIEEVVGRPATWAAVAGEEPDSVFVHVGGERWSQRCRLTLVYPNRQVVGRLNALPDLQTRLRRILVESLDGIETGPYVEGMFRFKVATRREVTRAGGAFGWDRG